MRTTDFETALQHEEAFLHRFLSDRHVGLCHLVRWMDDIAPDAAYVCLRPEFDEFQVGTAILHTSEAPYRVYCSSEAPGFAQRLVDAETELTRMGDALEILARALSGAGHPGLVWTPSEELLLFCDCIHCPDHGQSPHPAGGYSMAEADYVPLEPWQLTEFYDRIEKTGLPLPWTVESCGGPLED